MVMLIVWRKYLQPASSSSKLQNLTKNVLRARVTRKQFVIQTSTRSIISSEGDRRVCPRSRELMRSDKFRKHENGSLTNLGVLPRWLFYKKVLQFNCMKPHECPEIMRGNIEGQRSNNNQFEMINESITKKTGSLRRRFSPTVRPRMGVL